MDLSAYQDPEVPEARSIAFALVGAHMAAGDDRDYSNSISAVLNDATGDLDNEEALRLLAHVVFQLTLVGFKLLNEFTNVVGDPDVQIPDDPRVPNWANDYPERFRQYRDQIWQMTTSYIEQYEKEQRGEQTGPRDGRRLVALPGSQIP